MKHLQTDLKDYGITVTDLIRNAAPATYYEKALEDHEGGRLSDKGAIVIYSGKKTGRSPQDKRIVRHPESEHNVWWSANIPLSETTFMINRERAIDFLNTQPHLYILDGFAGVPKKHRIKIRIICSRAYHAIFMHNMLITPTAAELKTFGKPDYVIYNAGQFPANQYTDGMTSRTSVALSLERKEIVILGTEYAGEMKKAVFTVMNYIMPQKNILSMHCSANESPDKKVSLFFGLSGTGKTTLSADAKQNLIGDDEHCWSDEGIFNIEGGCYAKCIDLSREKEPEIYDAIRFGTVLENIALDPTTHEPLYEDRSITENTRAAYPLTFIANAKIPSIGAEPEHIIFLTFDAFGVFPPVSKLTLEQATYHFISGYTAKIAGTEVGIKEPQASFSACFGAPFMVWHPKKYADLLKKRISSSRAQPWLINTGWIGSSYGGSGNRISLKYTRAIIDAIHNGTLAKTPTQKEPYFDLQIPLTCPAVPQKILFPKENWTDKAAYDRKAKELVNLFQENFKQFADQ
ncbi:phosphoenolpyruvate carboxykinase (ATP) [Spirochaetota bacterium]|nr:phosphoenolpyruvate carboxykinase (ATP) [Spirochaetota bacterium]